MEIGEVWRFLPHIKKDPIAFCSVVNEAQF